jgi:hypothetical protein
LAFSTNFALFPAFKANNHRSLLIAVLPMRLASKSSFPIHDSRFDLDLLSTEQTLP